MPWVPLQNRIPVILSTTRHVNVGNLHSISRVNPKPNDRQHLDDAASRLNVRVEVEASQIGRLAGLLSLPEISDVPHRVAQARQESLDPLLIRASLPAYSEDGSDFRLGPFGVGRF